MMNAMFSFMLFFLFALLTQQAPIPMMKRAVGLMEPYKAVRGQIAAGAVAPVVVVTSVATPAADVPTTETTQNAETTAAVTSDVAASTQESSSVDVSTGANTDTSSGSGTGRFWGLTYSAYRDDGSCGTYEQVVSDLQSVSAVASNIRLYSTDCNQLVNVMKAVTDNNLDLTVYPGIWVSEGETRFQSELDTFVSVAKQYQGSSKMSGVSVGNEEILKNTGTGASTVIGYINAVKQRLSSEGLSGIQVYTTDTDQNIKDNPDVVAACDLIQVNVHTSFSSFVSIQDSADSAIQRAIAVRDQYSATGKPFRVGESGWPSGGGDNNNMTNEQMYAQRYTCRANSESINTFFFEAKDSLWKKGENAAEQSFGVFTSSMTRKFPFGGIGGRC